MNLKQIGLWVVDTNVFQKWNIRLCLCRLTKDKKSAYIIFAFSLGFFKDASYRYNPWVFGLHFNMWPLTLLHTYPAGDTYGFSFRLEKLRVSISDTIAVWKRKLLNQSAKR